MFDNNDLPNGGVQFAISHEVIAFLRWLAENNPEELKLLAKKAVSVGLIMQPQGAINALDDDETQIAILDFFGNLEIIMHEAAEAHTQHQVDNTHLQQTIDHIDGAFCDNGTVQASLEYTAHTLATNPEKSPKDLLFSELLKQWRPNNTQLLN
jgi:hypothetical protein